MSTLTEIETAIPHLEVTELSHLERLIRTIRLRRTPPKRSALDLPPLRVGKLLKPLSAEDDLLEEMLNDTRD